MADICSRETRSYNMSCIHSKDTKIEIAVRKYLFSRGFRYRKNDKRYPGHPDIVLPKYRSVVFVNGCFWHRHSDCKHSTIPKTNTDFWVRKLSINVQNDKKNIASLEELGWRVFVIWGCELGRDFENVLTKLVRAIKEE